MCHQQNGKLCRILVKFILYVMKIEGVLEQILEGHHNLLQQDQEFYLIYGYISISVREIRFIPIIWNTTNPIVIQINQQYLVTVSKAFYKSTKFPQPIFPSSRAFLVFFPYLRAFPQLFQLEMARFGSKILHKDRKSLIAHSKLMLIKWKILESSDLLLLFP